jgi:hypothetical protein
MYLLAEADTRTSIKGNEDEGVGCNVLLYSLVKETIRVELVGCGESVNISTCMRRKRGSVPSGPHRSLRRCIKKTL